MKKTKLQILEESSKKLNLLSFYVPEIDMGMTEGINSVINRFNQQPNVNNSIKKQKDKPLSLKPNFEDIDWQIDIIVKNSKDLFVSDFSQWKNLFSENITVFLKPIELKNKTTISDLRLFLENLRSSDLIKVSSFGAVIEKSNAFLYNGIAIKSKQLSDASNQMNYPNTLNAEKVHKIFKALKIKD